MCEVEPINNSESKTPANWAYTQVYCTQVSVRVCFTTHINKSLEFLYVIKALTWYFHSGKLPFNFKSFFCCFYFNISHWCWRCGESLIYSWIINKSAHYTVSAKSLHVEFLVKTISINIIIILKSKSPWKLTIFMCYKMLPFWFIHAHIIY